MAVYVDDMFTRADVPNGTAVVRGVWCHMFADTHEELEQMARTIHLRPSWIQHPGDFQEHYDVTKTKRAEAVRAGAVELPIGTEWRDVMLRKRQAWAEAKQNIVQQTAPPDHAEQPARVRVLVTGSREVTDVEMVRAALNACRARLGGVAMVLVHGDARGADSIARDLTRAAPDWAAIDEPHPAVWERPDGSTDRSAGHRRNAEMVSLGAAECLAFYRDGAGNRGTTACVRLVQQAGIPVVEHTQPA